MHHGVLLGAGGSVLSEENRAEPGPLRTGKCLMALINFRCLTLVTVGTV